MRADDDKPEPLRMGFLPKEPLEPNGHVIGIYEVRFVDDRKRATRHDRVVEHVFECAFLVWVKTQVNPIPEHCREVSAPLVCRQNDHVVRCAPRLHLPHPPHDDANLPVARLLAL